MNLTNKQTTTYRTIQLLQSLLKNDILSSSEIAQYQNMISKQKKKIVYELYFKNKKRKEFYTCKDGRVKSYDPQFIAKNEDELITKLYTYYFDNTFESVYKSWVHYRSETKIVSGKTIEEDINLWNRLLADSELSKMQIVNIKTKHLLKLFHIWTGNGLITRKDFNNRKSLLNGIFNYAVVNEVIDYNPLSSIACNEFKYKLPSTEKKAYTIQERTRLLDYLEKLEPDAYILAIKIAFHGIFRIGEIKGLSWNNSDGNKVTIQKQLVEERAIREDLTLDAPIRLTKNPKGNPNFSIRTEYVSQKGLEILTKMKSLNPTGEFLFMHDGKPLTTDTFNRRLKKYCIASGIPYLSSHKIRFTGASMLYNAGVKAVDIQPLLGHSTLVMTEHYIGQKVDATDTSQMSTILT